MGIWVDLSKFDKRSCPCCGRAPGTRLEVYTNPRGENSAFADLVSTWNGFFKSKAIFSYTRCLGCGLLFAPIFFTQEQLKALYAQMPPNMDVVPTSALSRTQRGYFEHLRSARSLTGDFLEVGPDIGLFTEHCVAKGSFDRFWLFEPNRAVATTLVSVVGDKPYSLVHEMDDFSIVPDSSISCAAMIHVLDHLLEPLKTLRELRAKLTENSRILIVTHDESSFLRRLLGYRWPAFCLQHPQLFNKASISATLRAAGFDVVKQARTVNHFQVQFLARHISFALGIRREVRLPFGDSVVGLKLGNIVTIASPGGMR
jgi:hypothetical protein